MRLTEAGEARVRGYLYVLKRSLESFMPTAAVGDALAELESHIRERIAQEKAEPDELMALEAILAALGQPLQVAQAYSGELVIEEAVTTGRVGAMARAVWHLATTTVHGFLLALGLLMGYALGLSFLAMGALKPIFPNNVGLLMVSGVPRAFGVFSSLPPGGEVRGGYWVIPIAIALGLGALVLTHRASKRFLVWWRGRGSKVLRFEPSPKTQSRRPSR